MTGPLLNPVIPTSDQSNAAALKLFNGRLIFFNLEVAFCSCWEVTGSKRRGNGVSSNVAFKMFDFCDCFKSCLNFEPHYHSV